MPKVRRHAHHGAVCLQGKSRRFTLCAHHTYDGHRAMGYTTDDPAQVTCRACLRILDEREKGRRQFEALAAKGERKG